MAPVYFIRDNFTYQKCGGKPHRFEAHHIKHFIVLLKEAQKYFPLLSLFDAVMLYTPLWDLINGITLCEECHKLEHKNSVNRLINKKN